MTTNTTETAKERHARMAAVIGAGIARMAHVDPLGAAVLAIAAAECGVAVTR